MNNETTNNEVCGHCGEACAEVGYAGDCLECTADGIAHGGEVHCQTDLICELSMQFPRASPLVVQREAIKALVGYSYTRRLPHTCADCAEAGRQAQLAQA